MSDHDRTYMDGDGKSHPDKRHYQKRSKTPAEWVVQVSAVIGALGIIFGGGAAVRGSLPEILGVAKADEVQILKDDVAQLKKDVGAIGLAQQETLELQLMSRLDVINDQLSTATDAMRIQSLRQTRNELTQRLQKVRAAIDAEQQ